ncbi:MAG: hypothetical protein ACK40X_07785 [Armatimonadota bacterium]
MTVYLSKEEYAQVRQVARRAGLSLSDVVRMCTMYVMNEVMTHMSFVEVVNKTVKKGGEKR